MIVMRESVSGSEAAGYDAVRLDSCDTVNVGKLTEAHVQTGKVVWEDAAGKPKDITLGPHAIRIIPRSPYRR